MTYFVDQDSIVRKIWGDADTILFIFAGASAEFALNRAVDWLYFTGKLPKDPLGRLFSTVGYARRIVFSEDEAALAAIDQITAIHQGVENKRGAKIPDWAYRDVLFMLIDYSIRSHELLKNRLSKAEKEEVVAVFNRVGQRMGIEGLPANFCQWEEQRASHLRQHLVRSHFTDHLYQQYSKHLGHLRYRVLVQAQSLVCPQAVGTLLRNPRIHWLRPVLMVYKFLGVMRAHHFLRDLILPKAYKLQIQQLDAAHR